MDTFNLPQKTQNSNLPILGQFLSELKKLNTLAQAIAAAPIGDETGQRLFGAYFEALNSGDNLARMFAGAEFEEMLDELHPEFFAAQARHFGGEK